MDEGRVHAPAEKPSAPSPCPGSLYRLDRKIFNPAQFGIEVDIATIGIRGTGFDLVWLCPCDGNSESCGLCIDVWEGEIQLTHEQGTTLIATGDSYFLPSAGSLPEKVDTPLDLQGPRPDLVDDLIQA